MASPLTIGKSNYWVQRLDVDRRAFRAAWRIMGPTPKSYDVALTNEGHWSCECESYSYGKGRDCKHLTAIKERFAKDKDA